MQYPLTLSFKLLAIASQIYIRDANGSLLGYVKQKLLKLKEDINVFADEQQSRVLFNIKADRVIDFSARYNFKDEHGRLLGSIKRKGMRSIFKANYEIFDPLGVQVMKIREENAWIKVIDSLAGEIPIVGMFSGYFFNPSYMIDRLDGKSVARLSKKPAFFEGVFELEKLDAISDEEETRLLLSVLTMTLLERARG